MGFQQLLGVGQPTAAAAAFTYDAVAFDGTTYLDRGGGLTGASDQPGVTMSAWLLFDSAGDGALNPVIWGNSSNLALYKGGGLGNAFEMDDVETGFANLAGVATTTAFTGSATWHHFIASIDLGVTLASRPIHMYADDVADETTVFNVGTGGNTFFTDTNWRIGAESGGSPRKFTGAMAELYMAPTYIDLTVTANRRKFVTAGLKPVDLGADGSTPTGSQPLMYHHIPASGTPANFANNLGSGGNFSVAAGSLTLAASKP